MGNLILCICICICLCFLYLPYAPLEAGDEETTRGLNEFQSKRLATHAKTFFSKDSSSNSNLSKRHKLPSQTFPASNTHIFQASSLLSTPETLLCCWGLRCHFSFGGGTEQEMFPPCCSEISCYVARYATVWQDVLHSTWRDVLVCGAMCLCVARFASIRRDVLVCGGEMCCCVVKYSPLCFVKIFDCDLKW